MCHNDSCSHPLVRLILDPSQAYLMADSFRLLLLFGLFAFRIFIRTPLRTPTALSCVHSRALCFLMRVLQSFSGISTSYFRLLREEFEEFFKQGSQNIKVIELRLKQKGRVRPEWLRTKGLVRCLKELKLYYAFLWRSGLTSVFEPPILFS